MDRADPWPPQQRLLVVVAAVVSIGLYAYSKLPIPPERLHSNDFKHLYLGAKIVGLGRSPYDAQTMLEAARLEGVGSVNPYVYLPFTAQALLPLGLIPFCQAARLWFWLNHVFLTASLALMASRLKSGNRALAFFALLFIAALWYPLTRTLMAGQLNCALLFLLTVHWLTAIDRRHCLSGFCLAFASLFKIAPGFLMVVLLFQRRWRLLAWSAGWFAFLFLVSVARCGPRMYLEFIPVLKQMGYGKSTWAEMGMEFYRDPFNQSFNAFFHHALTENPTVKPMFDLGPAFADDASRVVSVLLLAGAGVLFAASPPRSLRCWRGGQRRLDQPDSGFEDLGKETGAWSEADALDLAIAIIVMLLLPSIYWDHYAVLLLLPLGIMARLRPRTWEAAAMAFGALLLAIPQGFFHKRYSGQFAGALLFSMGLWGTIVLLSVAARMRLRLARSIQRSAQTQDQAI